jgi:hypothetical protein
MSADSNEFSLRANKNLIFDGGNDLGIYSDTISSPADRASLTTLLLGYALYDTTPGTAAKVAGEIKAKTNLTLTADNVVVNSFLKSGAGNESTGAGAALLGTNSPATTLAAPYTWVTLKTSDGSTVYMPVWK